MMKIVESKKLSRVMTSCSGDVMTKVSQSSCKTEADFPNSTESGVIGGRKLPKRVVRVATVNVDTLLRPGKALLLANELARYNIGIAGVQETRWKENVELEQGQYKVISSGGIKGEGLAGVALYIRKDLVKAMVGYRAISGRFMLARFRIGERRYLSVVTCYAPTENASVDKKEEFYHQLQNVCDDVKKHDRLMVLGDFNARVGSDNATWPGVVGKYGLQELSANGEMLLDWCVKNELGVMGTWFQHKNIHIKTWMHPDRVNGGQIDHVIVRQRDRLDVQDVRVCRGFDISENTNGHGHYLVMSEVKLKFRKTQSKPKVEKFDHERLKDKNMEDRYNREVSAKWSKVKGLKLGSAEEEWSGFKDAITSTARVVLGTREYKKKPPWISEQSLELAERKRRKRLELFTFGHDEEWLRQRREEYATLAKETQKSCRRDKEAWWASIAEKMEHDAKSGRLKESYGVLKTFKSGVGRALATVKAKDGTLLDTEVEVLNRWTEHFRGVLMADKEVPELRVEVECDGGEECSESEWAELDAEPTYAEVSRAVRKVAKGKAAGEDLITVELLQSKACIEWLHRVVVATWRGEEAPRDWQDGIVVPLYKGKGSRQECDNSRGITLLSIPGKVYARVIQHRLVRFAERRLSENQNGFRAGRSCMDTLFTVKRLMEMSSEKQKELWLIFVDFTKAYDTVVRGRLWKVLQEMGAPRGFVNRIAALHRDTHVKVRFGSLLGEEFRTKLGLRQGCVLAPILFNLYLESIMGRASKDMCGVEVRVSMPKCGHEESIMPGSVVVSESRFADDMTICEGSREAAVKSFCAVRDRAAKEGNLMVSEKKTKIMVMNSEETSKSIEMAGMDLERVKKFVLVGSELNEEGPNGSVSEVRRRRALAAASFEALKRPLWKRSEISVKTKMRVFNACVMSRLLYGAETWTMYASDLESLEAFQNNCLRRILRSSWMDYITGVEVRRRCCGQPTMEEILRGRRLQWVGHMQRMGRERLPKAMLWGEMDGGVRRQGRPTKTWWDGVKDDLKELGLVLHWRKLCQNREKWGKSIKPVKRKATKGELAAGRATKAELRSQGSRASGRLRERSGQGGPGGSGRWHQGASQVG